MVGDEKSRPFAHALRLSRCPQWEGRSERLPPESSSKRLFSWPCAILPSAAVRARKLMRQKSPAPTKDKRVGKTNRFVPALVKGLAQACLIGDQPQSRHPDELTRQAHLARGWTEEPHRWRLNLRAGSPGVAMSRVDLTNPRRHNPRESTP